MVYWSSGLCSVAIARRGLKCAMVSCAPASAGTSAPSMSILMKSTRGSFNSATSLSIVVSGTRTLGCADSGRITTLLAAKLVSSTFSVRVSSLSHTPFGYTITRPPAVSAARLRRMHSTLEGEISIRNHRLRPGLQRLAREIAVARAAIQHHVAGWALMGPVEDTPIAEARAQMETNLFGVLRVCRAALPVMREQRSGHIVNISSLGGIFGIPFSGIYSAEYEREIMGKLAEMEREECRGQAAPKLDNPKKAQAIKKLADARASINLAKPTQAKCSKITVMLNFRQFEVGPDPFGRKWQGLFKWLQAAISLRHSDTVDVKFILESDGTRVQKQIAIPHADLLELSRRTGHEMSDAWCARLAALHLKRMVESGEDLEKDLVTVRLNELAGYAAEIAREEGADLTARRGAA